MKGTFMKNYEYGLNVLETQFKQRAYDGKWERIAKIMDYEQKYTYSTESGQKVSLIPEKWVTVGVYDYMLEFQD
jgi:hypothetical protein